MIDRDIALDSEPPSRGRAVSLALLVLALFSSGCAFGRTVAYTETAPRIEASGTYSVGVAVHDQRKRSPMFVGEMRSLYHIPYGVHTASGKPLAEDLTTALVTSFSSKGFAPVSVATAVSESPDEVVRRVMRLKVDRGVVLTLFEWRTDTYFTTQLFYDLGLKVIDPSGTVLGQHQVVGHEDELKETPSSAFRTRLELLLNYPEVAQALAMNRTPTPAAVGGGWILVDSTGTRVDPEIFRTYARCTAALAAIPLSRRTASCELLPATPVVSPAPTPAPAGPPPGVTQQWRVFSYAPGMTDRTALAEPAPTVEACRLVRNALEPHHPGRILACEVAAP